MSSIKRREGNATELHLDYDEISAGRLVIVIRGLPDGVGEPALQRRREGPSSPLVEEAEAVNATGQAPALVTALVLAAWRGQEARTSELIAAAIEVTPPESRGRVAVLADHAQAVLCNGLGRYRDAAAAAGRACGNEGLGSAARTLVELVEAAARCDARSPASNALTRLEECVDASGTDWALGVRARSAALLSEGRDAERLYGDAIDLLGHVHGSLHLARAQLVYGEWLRRANRRVDARVQLRAAHETFSDLGAAAFADRAGRELLATGETARKRTDEARAHLTPQEAHIALLARDGLSNPEIGARLFLSPRTVQYHLRKVFRKLDISSRTQLGRVPSGRLELA